MIALENQDDIMTIQTPPMTPPPEQPTPQKQEPTPPKECNFTTLEPNDSFTEGYYHWKPQKAYPRNILMNSRHWQKLHMSQPPPSHQIHPSSFRIDQQKLFTNLLLEQMHHWTSFHYMGMLERELLWLVEMSDMFKFTIPGDRRTRTITWYMNTKTNDFYVNLFKIGETHDKHMAVKFSLQLIGLGNEAYVMWKMGHEL
jgi:hypothetical protein